MKKISLRKSFISESKKSEKSSQATAPVAISIPEEGPSIELTRRDLIDFEQQLRANLVRVINFTAHGLYFPAHIPDAASYLADEQSLLVPLRDAKGIELGLFIARHVEDSPTVQALLPFLPAIVELCLDNLLLYKRTIHDSVSGLYVRQKLLEIVGKELERIREPAYPESLPDELEDAESMPETKLPEANGIEFSIASRLGAGRGSFALLVVRVAGLRRVVRGYGYSFADSLITVLGERLQQALPEQVIAARVGEYEFAVFIPTATRKTCQKIAESSIAAISSVRMQHDLTQKQVSVSPSVGYVLYPQELEASLGHRSSLEQARLLLRKARLSAAVAEEQGGGQCMPFGHITHRGGRIAEALPFSRAIVTLGSHMNAREGQRFSIWSQHAFDEAAPPPYYKGELRLLDVGEYTSQADIIHIEDANRPLSAGDQLLLLTPDISYSDAPIADDTAEPIKGLYRYSDFLAHLSYAREDCETFTLSLIRLDSVEPQYPRHFEEPAVNKEKREHSIRQVMSLCTSFFSKAAKHKNMDEAFFGGQYSINSIILFHPQQDAHAVSKQYHEIAQILQQEYGIRTTIGLAAYPFLSFHKSDCLNNCRKALEYATLLPEPHIGICNSLALTISADKNAGMGDYFSAIEEYKQALLADISNTTAWNSLGVCLAGVGKKEEARHCLTEALEHDPGNLMTLYNLGTIYQSMSDYKEAAHYYARCLEENAEHLFAMVRLGQLEETQQAYATARDWYTKAAAVPGGAGMTKRYLARLCLREGKADAAREHLHEALLYDPQDAMALCLMARLYMDGGEDPELAESLARQSIALQPKAKAGWLELARSLEAQGRITSAREALYRAESAQ